MFFTIRAIFTMIRDRRIENNSAFFIIKIYRFRANLQNATHFVGVAYPPNKISKTVLKMQAFYSCFMKFCLALNSYKLLFRIQLDDKHLVNRYIDCFSVRKLFYCTSKILSVCLKPLWYHVSSCSFKNLFVSL